MLFIACINGMPCLSIMTTNFGSISSSVFTTYAIDGSIVFITSFASSNHYFYNLSCCVTREQTLFKNELSDEITW